MNGQLHNDNNNITASNNKVNKWEMIIKFHNKEQQLIEKYKIIATSIYNIILNHTVISHGTW